MQLREQTPQRNDIAILTTDAYESVVGLTHGDRVKIKRVDHYDGILTYLVEPDNPPSREYKYEVVWVSSRNLAEELVIIEEDPI